MNSVLALLAIGLVHATSAASFNASGIQCEEGKTGCSECYITLAKCLMFNDDNVFNITKIFLPPNKQTPVFVRVNYKFPSGETKRWYWTTISSTLLYPLDGFQFYSLLFGNHKPFRSGEVFLTLPTECSNASREYFQVLTQRLKAHASTQSATPLFRDADDANSGNKDLVENRIHSDELAAVLYIYQALIPILSTAGVCIIITMKIDLILPKKQPHEDRNGTAFIISVLAIVISLFAIGMDICGIIFSRTDAVPEYSDAIGEPNTRALFYLPILMLTTYDCLAFITVLVTIAIIGVIVCCKYYQSNCCKDRKSSHLQILAVIVSVLAITFILSNHSYFIIIAFVNDAVHANSIGIYYVITVVGFLFILKGLWSVLLRINTCMDKWERKIREKVKIPNRIRNKQLESVIEMENVVDLKSSEDNKLDNRNPRPSCMNCKVIAMAGTVLLVVSLLVLFQILITSTFAFVPIKRTIEDVPARISSIYQSLFVVLGALITYHIFIKEDTGLESIIKSALIRYAKKKNLSDTGNGDADAALATNLVEHYLENYYKGVNAAAAHVQSPHVHVDIDQVV